MAVYESPWNLSASTLSPAGDDSPPNRRSESAFGSNAEGRLGPVVAQTGEPVRPQALHFDLGWHLRNLVFCRCNSMCGKKTSWQQKTFKKLCSVFVFLPDSREFNQTETPETDILHTVYNLLYLTRSSKSFQSVWLSAIPFPFPSIFPYFDWIRCADVAIISTEVLAPIRTSRGRCTYDCFYCKQLYSWLIHTD